ncbi:putative acetyltransferase [Gemmobacter caeni]|uniref:Uncharacterized protein n=1 Tax=Gemmobacter caeni TaxID=589035 RepID=A0A2T6B1M5_9RHOB|nr:hypothetical protein [Gemmobacter caeni]PTX49971.1 hypothetical protein C8N34_106153 [Gemmobacter caeni]TWJ01866.1 putative acetyltransferase [Gemmobacter caeni]
MTPRPEGADEAAVIGRLITDAFATAAHSDGNEAEIVAALRASGDLLLSLVCEDGHGLTGHIAASPSPSAARRAGPVSRQSPSHRVASGRVSAML